MSVIDKNSWNEEAVPVLQLIAARLVSNPDWSMNLLETTTHKLLHTRFRYLVEAEADLTQIIGMAEGISRRHMHDANSFAMLAQLLAKVSRHEESLQWIDRALALKGGEAEFHRLRASLLETKGRLREAEASIRHAIELAPGDSALQEDLVRIGQALLAHLRQERNGSDLHQAIEAATAIVHRCQDDPHEMASLAHLLVKAGRLEESLLWIDKATALKDDEAEFHRLRASLLETTGRLLEAEMSILRAIELAPGDSALQDDLERIGRALVVMLRQERDASTELHHAMETAEAIVQRCPDVPQEMAYLAQLLVKTGRHEESLLWIDRAIALKGDEADFYRLRASLLETSGCLKEAEESLLRAIELLPDDCALQEDLRRIGQAQLANLRQERNASDLPQAIAVARAIVQRCSDDPHEMAFLAQLLDKTSRHEESLQWIDRALALKDDEAEFHRLRASLLETTGRLREAEASIQRAIELAPGDSAQKEDLVRIGQALLAHLREERSASDLHQAIEATTAIVHRCQDDAHEMASLAHLLVKAGRLEESLQWIDEAIALKDDEAEFHRLRASLLETMGRLREAEESVRRAIELASGDFALQEDLERIGRALIVMLRQERNTSTELRHAVETAEAIVQRCPDVSQEIASLAHLLTKAGRLEESLQWIDKAIALKDDEAEFHRLRASLCETTGRLRDANASVRRAMELAPGHSAIQEDKRRIRKKYFTFLLLPGMFND